jgi:diadenosine tetraphosphate (Ap4A) HIT family hydrolase
MNECLFCKLAQAKQNIIYENDYFYSIFDANPVSPGYSLVIPKRHIVKFLELGDDEWLSMKEAILMTEQKINETDLKMIYQNLVDDPLNERSKKLCESMLNDENICKHPDAYNIGVNDGEAAGRTIHHLHIHIIPRFLGDTEKAAGGIRHILRHKDIGSE